MLRCTLYMVVVDVIWVNALNNQYYHVGSILTYIYLQQSHGEIVTLQPIEPLVHETV